MLLKDKIVISIGDKDGIPADMIALNAQAMGADKAFSSIEYFV
ncbi:hypothetical protein [Anaerospora sp.]|jgi:cell shape-determining protein MreC|nr:hypothetical protein [Anaerospora sp.]MDF2928399.1 Glycine reductase complex selenoprotein [Anaerospora sp.]